MIEICKVETVNFYNDPIEVAEDDTGRAYVSLSQITGYLGLDHEEIIEKFSDDPRVEMDLIDDVAIIDLMKLPGFLMLLPYDRVPAEFKDDLLRYQVECFDVLHNYWIHGIAVNRRETPFDVTSKFKDERAVSRVALTKAIAAYTKNIEGARELGLDSDLFDKVLMNCYNIIGLEPSHEYEKLTGAEARYLAWTESVFAKTFDKFAKFGELYDDPIGEALGHVVKHLKEAGRAWYKMADNVPAGLYHT